MNLLEKFGPEDPDTMLSLPFEGYTFAIDFPIGSELDELTKRLDSMFLDASGHIYLGKDAFVDSTTFTEGPSEPKRTAQIVWSRPFAPASASTPFEFRRPGDPKTFRVRLAPRPPQRSI